MCIKPFSAHLCNPPRWNLQYFVPYFYATESSSQKKFVCLNPKRSKLLAFYNFQITKNGRIGNLIAAESVFKRMPFKNVVSWTALLTAYAENGKISNARNVFNEMPDKNVASWNAMISAYASNLQIEEAFSLFEKMPERNIVSYTAMMSGYIQVGKLNEAEKLYGKLTINDRDSIASNVLISGYLKFGKLDDALRVFEGMTEKDVVTWSSIIDGYCKHGKICDARELFDRMPQRNVVSWTAMINGYLRMGMKVEGFDAFSQMRKDNIKINSTTVTVLVDACVDIDMIKEGTQIHGLVVLMGFESDVFLNNSIITMYSMAGCMISANRIFNLMKKKDVVSWNSLMAGYVKNNNINEAHEIFRSIPKRDVVSWTTMVAGFAKAGKMMESINLFVEMPQRDDIAWTAIISGFVNCEAYERAVKWFVKMVREGIRLNPVAISCVLSASSNMAMVDQGEQIHGLSVKLKLDSIISVQNSLISMYLKCGCIDEGRRIFDSIKEPNHVSMNSVISGLAQNGYGEKALEMFRRMQVLGIEPNEITFLGVLSACSHVGLVKDGYNYFISMKTSYQIEPGLDHYACMIDIYSRAGLLKEAIDLIKSMPFTPHSGVWGAVLNASRNYFDLDLAKLAAQNLCELEPDNPTPYVVLSSMYSIAGLKKDEEILRKAFKSKGIKKSPGCSWIIVNNKVHLFRSGVQLHENFAEICSCLMMVAAIMEG